MKAFTDIKQSAQLALLLPAESADMWWSKNFIYYYPTVSIGIGTEYNNVYTYKFGEDDIPCWSLSALLDVLPYPQLSKDKLGSGKEGWMVSAYPDNCRYDSCWHGNQVDACYEMILKLHELKML